MLFIYIHVLQYMFIINLYFMTLNNKWVCSEKIIYNEVWREVEKVGNPRFKGLVEFVCTKHVGLQVFDALRTCG
jgi:hypothetical protein